MKRYSYELIGRIRRTARAAGVTSRRQAVGLALLVAGGLVMMGYLVTNFVTDEPVSLQLEQLRLIEHQTAAPPAGKREVWDSWRQKSKADKDYGDGFITLRYEQLEQVVPYLQTLRRQGWRMVQERSDGQVANRLYENDTHAACIATHTERGSLAGQLRQSVTIYDGAGKICRTGHGHYAP